ncbi:TetR/AcrR family transcriptional regulator [Paludibaculum fermentans]|uniref:TetR/AcrR family transcriptional regulator n=1 Tax=Paludibaculum fermentans TaxID=1473598 RepID=UPI003EBFEE40
MKVSREKMAENRRRILSEAARLFKAHGFESVTVSDVMNAAGLTHGGFYGHFKSKDNLIAETLAYAVDSTDAVDFDLSRYAAAYLSHKHRDDLAGGCPTASLGSETIRQSPEARAAMTAGLRRQIERFAKTVPGNTTAEKRQAAIGTWAAMVGGLILARLSDDPKLSDEILAQTRAWIRSNGVTSAS